MRAPFLKKLIKKFPNDFQLGKAIRRYYHLRQNKLSKEECEEIVLKETFSFD
tara:strand:- start:345 stop:500 length:156 start_codon:yes stop_codon:yes gene_type:complete